MEPNEIRQTYVDVDSGQMFFGQTAYLEEIAPDGDMKPGRWEQLCRRLDGRQAVAQKRSFMTRTGLSVRTICGLCGPVDHQPIPEDEAHCDCEGGEVSIWDSPSLRWLKVDCFCLCHYNDEDEGIAYYLEDTL